MVGDVRDVITCAEFQIKIFMGYDFTGGRIFDFAIDFSMGLTTVQRYCAACDTSADDRLERLVSEMTCYVPSRTTSHKSTYSTLVLRLCSIVSEFFTGSAVALHCVKAHRQSQWRSPNFNPL